MSITIDIQSDLAQLAARLEAAPASYRLHAEPTMKLLLSKIARLERSLMHVQSGRMRASTYPEGPFNVGEGTLEGTIGPHVEYAIHEIEKGGAHDFLTQTVGQMQPLIHQALQGLEQALSEAVNG